MENKRNIVCENDEFEVTLLLPNSLCIEKKDGKHLSFGIHPKLLWELAQKHYGIPNDENEVYIEDIDLTQ